jgi:hypothetical protein
MNWEEEAYLRKDADGNPISLVSRDMYMDHLARHVLMNLSGGVQSTY